MEKVKPVGRVDVSRVMAPYNFVPFENKSLSVGEKDMRVRGRISRDLLSGEISYKVTAKTPIFVDDGAGNFYRNEYNIPAIPGTTIRGLIRANALVLGLGDYSDDVEDYRLMYRNVAAGAERKRYGDILGAKSITMNDGQNVSILQNVRAGYMVNEGGKFYIYKTVINSVCAAMGEINYYILSERHISKHYNEPEFAFFRKHPQYTQNCVDREFKKEEYKGRIHYKNNKNKDYAPFYAEVSYSIKNERYVSAVGEPGEYENEGYLVGSGYMNEKKVLYVIPKMDKGKCIDISNSKTYSASLVDFKRDFKARENTLKQYKNVDFFNLPNPGEIKPVFYIELDGKLYFGFTPRLRLFYDHSIKEGFKKKKTEYDYVKSIFGCINDKTGYKSKVSFSDAVITKEEVGLVSKRVILGEPKPTSYLDYLVQNEGENPATYNTKGFELRGAKKYWLHKDIVESGSNDNEKVKSTINALKEETEFIGTIRFQNLTEAELGLLIWSLRLEKDSEVNIGKAKPYGFGRSKISDIKLKLFDKEKAYSTDALCLEPFKEDMDIDAYVKAYKKESSDKLGRNIEDLPSVKALMLMSDSRHIPDDSLTRYMSLDNKEYQRRVTGLIPLPYPDEIAGEKRTGNLSKSNNGVIEAKVFKIDDFGNILLKKDNQIEMNSRIFSKDVEGTDIKPGDKIKVKFKNDNTSKNGRVYHNYLLVR